MAGDHRGNQGIRGLTMADIRLVDGDIQASNTYVSGIEQTAQRIAIRLGTFAGEWVLDESVGVPYVSWMGRKVDVQGMDVFFKGEIDDVVGVAGSRVTVTFDRRQRGVTVAGDVTYSDGTSAPFSVFLRGVTGSLSPPLR